MTALMLVVMSPASFVGAVDDHATRPLYDRLDTGFEIARILYERPGNGRDEALANLQRMALDLDAEVFAEGRKIIEQLGWPSGLQALAARAMAWRNELDAMTPDKVFETALAFIASRDSAFRSNLGEYLLFLADRRGSDKAAYHIAQRYFEEDSGRVSVAGHSTLLQLAKKGYLPAQLDAASRYRTGRGLPANRMRAFYWLYRAEQNGGDVGKELAALRRDLLPGEVERALEYIRKGRLPYESLPEKI